MASLPDALSFCMIVKNEERDLPNCLDSVQGLASEFVVADTGSTDATREILAGYGAKIIPFDFTRIDFAAARNCALDHANRPWILMLDADETVEAAAATKIERLLADNNNAGFFLERHNHSSDSAATITDYVVRLFPNRPELRYRGRVHETIDNAILAAGGRLITTDIAIEHNFVSDREMRRHKNHWYIQILEEEIAAAPNDDSRLDFLAAEYHQLEMYDRAAAIMEEIVGRRPKDARAWLFLGTYHLLYQNNPALARADFEQALKLRPGYVEAISFLQRMDRSDGK